MFPGGYKSHLKEWPQEYWIKIINFLTKRGFHINLTGTLKDRKKALKIYNSCKRKNYITISAGMLSLKETTLLLKRSKLVISVNTGIMHIAAALNCNLIALHGPTSSKRWGPLNKNAISIQSPIKCSPCLNLGFEYKCNKNKCMQAISPEIVINSIKYFL